MRLLAKAIDCEMKLLVQLLQVATHQVAHLYILEVMPSAFIPRVEVRGISRQCLQPHLPLCLSHKLLDGRPAVDRRAIPDYQQPLPRYPQQVREELDAMQPIERLLPHQSVALASQRPAPHDREVIACQLLADDWRLRLGA